MLRLPGRRHLDPAAAVGGLGRHHIPVGPDRELYEAGALLPGPGAILAGPTFAGWLDAAG